MAKKPKSRLILTALAAGFVAALLIFAFWPSPTMVDIGTVTRGPMQVTIDEEGRTRVHDTFVVSAPVDGQLLRIEAEPGDLASAGMVIARMTPTPLDARSRAQAQAAIASAQASIRAARESVEKARSDKRLADAELAREQELWELQSTSRAALDLAKRDAENAQAALESAQSSVAMREAELAEARARLLGSASGASGGAIALRAPASGRILEVMQESAATLAAGTPIVEIGDVGSDLEVLVELLSTDAVTVSLGDPVLIEGWGGDTPLRGADVQLEPQGFTKVSALGVEEQRVNAIVRLSADQPESANLGSGFRVEARIIVWQDRDALIVPASALFRDQGHWAVLAVDGGEAVLRRVTIGRNNGTQAQVLEGLEEGAQVVLYPSSDLADGEAVEQREVG